VRKFAREYHAILTHDNAPPLPAKRGEDRGEGPNLKTTT